MADYRESTVTGTAWQRVCRVEINNPLNGVPTALFVEEKAVSLGEGNVITTPCANLSVAFDANNELHQAIYAKLNELYALLREARDAAAAA